VRVVLVIRRLMDVGGAQTQARLLARELTCRGHAVVILTERVAHIRPPTALEGISVHGVRSVAVRCLGSLLYVAGLMWYLITRRSQYDLVHVFFLKESALGAVAAGALVRVPVVVRPACAGPPGDLHPLRRRPLWRHVMGLCRHASAFVALSDALVDELTGFGCPRRRIHRIASGIAVPERVAPPSASPPVVLFIGRLDAQKGLTVLLEAWRRVAPLFEPGPQSRRPAACPPGQRQPHTAGQAPRGTPHLVLLGDGPQRADLEALARRLGITASVTFAGIVGNVPARLARARAFVLPSTDEGMSSALLEAMAAGRAIVATRVSGSTELIADGVHGLLADVDDVPGLAAAIERVIVDPDLADRLGENARRRVREHYTVERLADAHLALYHSLVKRAAVGEGRRV